MKWPLVIFFLLFQICVPAYAKQNEVITDETIRRDFDSSKQIRDTHSVMAEQKTRLVEMVQGFLDGDLDSVGQQAAEINSALKDMPAFVQPTEETQAQVWQSLSTIKKNMQSVQEAVQNKDYKKAYNGYMNATYQCIQCHQATRSWGKLAELEPENGLKPSK